MIWLSGNLAATPACCRFHVVGNRMNSRESLNTRMYMYEIYMMKHDSTAAYACQMIDSTIYCKHYSPLDHISFELGCAQIPTSLKRRGDLWHSSHGRVNWWCDLGREQHSRSETEICITRYLLVYARHIFINSHTYRDMGSQTSRGDPTQRCLNLKMLRAVGSIERLKVNTTMSTHRVS